MSEADTPNNTFPGADQVNPSSSPDEKSGPSTVPVSEEVRQSLDFQAFSSWVEAAETRMSALPMAETETASASPTVETDVAAMSSELTEMAALTQELHSTNSHLLRRITQLEQKLAESQKVVQQHRKRSQAQEAMFTEKQHELTEAQEQTRRLFYELDAAHQTTQRQQILIETLTDQLEISQEQVAQLERECASTQAICNQQSHHLVETENTCRELRSRLSRQQRHTLQFKVALEKCLEVPIPCQAQSDTIPLETSTPGFDRTEAPLLVSKAQPIPPWSAQTEPSGEESPWDSPSPTSTGSTWTDQSTALEVVEVATDVPTEVTLTYPTFGQQFSQAVSTPKGTFEEQLDDLLNLLFQPSSTPVTPPGTTPAHSLNEDTSGTMEAQWQAASSLPEGTVIPTPNTSPDILASAIASSPSTTLDPAGSVLNQSHKSNDDRKDLYPNDLEETDSRKLLPLFDGYQRSRLLPVRDHGSDQGSDRGSDWGSDRGSSITQASLPETDSSKTNSPAPIVYPLRPPKGRKSLAAVELPTFPLLQT